jgi:Dinucleotide-utilizing enzymes involved in molybdopterin and thiamine biosynthesis family 2
MSDFTIKKSSEDNPFDRQERIEWWSQERLKNARVLVIGAGAIGNETLKNFALLGIGNILVCDMDTISVSNLSRTVLFRKEDAGRKKAETAALRTKEMSLEETCSVDFFDGDIVWELGTGVFRYFDVIVGCLDNVETRFALNVNCRLVNKSWVDAGINELSGSIRIFGAGEGACYQCFANDNEMIAARQRYSCDDFKKRMFSEHKMPTVQISSAIVSALQVQEAIKIILGKTALVGKKIFFQGTTGDFEVINMREDPDCYAHASFENVIETPMTSKTTLRDFLTYVSKPEFSGTNAVLTFYTPAITLNRRQFLHSITCEHCGHTTYFNKPSFRLYTDEVKCSKCSMSVTKENYVYLDEFTLDDKQELLDLVLEDIGIPKLHIIAVRDSKGDYKYYELSGDVCNVLPLISAKEKNNAK